MTNSDGLGILDVYGLEMKGNVMRMILFLLLGIFSVTSSVLGGARELDFQFPSQAEKLMVVYLSETRVDTGSLAVCAVTSSDEKWKQSDASVIMDKLNAFAPQSKFVLVADKLSGPTAMEFIDRYYERLAGVVMLSVIPVTRTPFGVDVWAPRGDAWKVPLWVTASSKARQANESLLMWRRVYALKPANASFTIDPGNNPLYPSSQFSKWIEQISQGKVPPPAKDLQVVEEYRRYSPYVDYLLEAMKKSSPASSGEKYEKTEGPFKVAGTAPAGWFRVKEGEKKYERQTRDYVQLYFKAAGDTPRSTRVMAALDEDADLQKVLDNYEKFLQRAGYLVVRYKRWKASGKVMQINSILWPSGGKWHRWLILAGTTDDLSSDNAASLVVVMDGSEKPNVNLIASSFKRFITNVEARTVQPERLKK